MIFALVLRTLFVVAIFGHSIFLMMQGHLFWGLLENATFVGFLLYGTLSPNSRLFGSIKLHSDGGPLLTIDDGPDPDDTPVILDLLDEFETKAIFFLIGEKAERHPELVREIHRRGHTIGNHTWSHPQISFWAAGPWRTWREIRRCQVSLTEITGESPKFFRAPVGHSNFFVHPILKALDLRLMGWSARGYDAVAKESGPVLNKIQESLSKEGIVLVHEGTPIAQEVIREVLEMIKGQSDIA